MEMGLVPLIQVRNAHFNSLSQPYEGGGVLAMLQVAQC